MSKTTVVSAPGKLLLVGGYLVLDEGNVGVPIGVDARFYASCTTTSDRADSANVNAKDAPTTRVTVVSPQFASQWTYEWHSMRHTLEATTITDQPPNPFVEKALRVALLYIDATLQRTGTDTRLHDALTLTLVADNDFYSLVPHLQQRQWPCTLDAAQRLPLRLPAARDTMTGRIYKTGLGSSACLVTALTGALVHHYLDACISNNPTVIIARLSQIGHCHAQGKVGSGFDVSAACFGSHVYQRFGAAVLAPVLAQLERCHDDNANETVAALVCDTVNTHAVWANAGVVAPVHGVAPTSLLQVIMADVSGGSESPSMAKHVLQWKNAQSNSSKNENAEIVHWDDLARLNRHVVDVLQRIHTLQPEANATVHQQLLDVWKDGGWSSFIANTSSSSDANDPIRPLAVALHELRDTLTHVRRHLKAMGVAAQVPIEPDAQSALCDACLDIPGVVAALVPGAGGHDAVACVYLNDDATRHAIAQRWATWPHATVCALTVAGVAPGDGVRVEAAFPTCACD